MVKEVKDATPPKKPEVAFTFGDDCTWIDVKGEVGCDIYIRHNSKKGAGKWKYMGTLKGMDLGFHVDGLPGIMRVDAGDTFSIRLVDNAGNKSKIATTKAAKEDWHPMPEE